MMATVFVALGALDGPARRFAARTVFASGRGHWLRIGCCFVAGFPSVAPPLPRRHAAVLTGALAHLVLPVAPVMQVACLGSPGTQLHDGWG